MFDLKHHLLKISLKLVNETYYQDNFFLSGFRTTNQDKDIKEKYKEHIRLCALAWKAELCITVFYTLKKR